MTPRRFLTAILVVCLLLSGLPAWGSEAGREKLRGLKGVGVFVEPLRPELEHEGLSRRQIQEDVESRLRRAGITVFSGTHRPTFQGPPFIYVNLSIGKLEQSYAYTVDLMCLAPSQVSLAAWNVESSGLIGHLLEVRDKVGELVERFIQDYRAVNPA